MQNLLTAQQIKDADAYTIKHQSISSIDLMERASHAFVDAFKKLDLNKKQQIGILCGQGNNGGDGLAIARLLHIEKYECISVYLIQFSDKQSEDNKENLKLLENTTVPIYQVMEPNQLADLKVDVVIDAILGTGLNQPLKDNYAKLAKLINQINAKVVSVDLPTGLNGEGEILMPYRGIKADLAISFQLPKLNFFFAEVTNALNEYQVVEIGLDTDFIQSQKSHWKLITKSDIKEMIRPRKNFDHKGTYGHALLVAGNDTTMGAALLAASACLHSGAGLTTVCLPQAGLTTLNTSLPEVMALPRNEELAMGTFEKFNVIAIGPGLGIDQQNEVLLAKLISLQKAMVIDADGLTILAKRQDLLNALPSKTILTPHMKEFDRLFGEHQNWWQRVETARENAKLRDLIIVLKNQYTFICFPNGQVHVNPTGNPAMASGGMGDVLTGVICSLLAQGYPAEQAAILAVYLHGKAGDELAQNSFTVVASQVARQIPKTMRIILQ